MNEYIHCSFYIYNISSMSSYSSSFWCFRPLGEIGFLAMAVEEVDMWPDHHWFETIWEKAVMPHVCLLTTELNYSSMDKWTLLSLYWPWTSWYFCSKGSSQCSSPFCRRHHYPRRPSHSRSLCWYLLGGCPPLSLGSWLEMGKRKGGRRKRTKKQKKESQHVLPV